MKLFYILMLTALLSLFGAGCAEETTQEGDPTSPGNTPTPEQFIVVTSILSKQTVTVKSGEKSSELNVGGCIAVPKSLWAGLEIIAGSNTLCGGEGDAAVACEHKNVMASRNDDNTSSVLVDSHQNGCTQVLGEEEQPEEPAADDTEQATEDDQSGNES